MSILCAIMVFIGFTCLINGFFDSSYGGSYRNDKPEANKDIERLRQIADYDRWSNDK